MNGGNLHDGNLHDGEHEASASELTRRSASAIRRVAIIGGGVSGMAAALRLRERGFDGDVVLYERSGRLGGLVETVRQDGFLIERGADSFITSGPGAVELCRSQGLADELIHPNAEHRRSLIVHDSVPVPTPNDFHLCVPRDVTAVLESPLLSTAGKLRFLREACIPVGEPKIDESLADFCTRRFGPETLARIVQAIAAGIYSADPHELSMASTMPQFLRMERDFGSLTAAGHAAKAKDAQAASGARYGLFATLPDGLSQLVDAAGKAVEETCDVRLQSPIERLDRFLGGWEIAGESFDGLVLALPAVVAANLLPTAPSLSAITAASSAIVASGYQLDQFEHPLEAFGMVVPFAERSPVTAVSFASRKFPGRAPEGCILVRTFVGGPHGEACLNSEAEIRDVAAAGLKRFLGLRGEPITTLVSLYRAASPQYKLHHAERVAAIEHEIAALPNVSIAGASYRGVGLPDAITSGRNAAEALLTANEFDASKS